MFWLARPPYVRWAAALALVVTAFALDLAPPATVPHPFAAVDLPAGAEVTEEDVSFREVPAGLLDPVTLPFVTGRPVAAGAPLLASDRAEGPPVPEGWWSIELPVPAGTGAGTEVRLVTGADDPVPGIVVAVPAADGFAEPVALVAVPGDAAVAVAEAAADRRVTVLVGR